MEQKSRSIHDFNPGDIVTRVEPTSSVSQSVFIDVSYDCSYVGEKLIFIGIANGCAYFELTDSFSYLIEKNRLIDLPLHRWERGWAYYIDPTTLLKAKPRSKYESWSDLYLIDRLDEAIEAENYEEASRIKHEIDKREL